MSKRKSPKSSTESSTSEKRGRSKESVSSSNSFDNSNSNEQEGDEGGRGGGNERNLPKELQGPWKRCQKNLVNRREKDEATRSRVMSGETIDRASTIESTAIITTYRAAANTDQPGPVDQSRMNQHDAQSTDHSNVGIIGQPVDHRRKIEDEQSIQRQIDKTTIDVRDLERIVPRFEEKLKEKRAEQEMETDKAKKQRQIHQTHRVKHLLDYAFALLESGRYRLIDLKQRLNGYQQLVSKAVEHNYTPADGVWILEQSWTRKLVQAPVVDQNQPVDIVNDQFRASGEVQQGHGESVDDFLGQNQNCHSPQEGAHQLCPMGQSENPSVEMGQLYRSDQQQNRSIAGGGLEEIQWGDFSSPLPHWGPVCPLDFNDSMNGSVMETPTLDTTPPPYAVGQQVGSIPDKPMDPS